MSNLRNCRNCIEKCRVAELDRSDVQENWFYFRLAKEIAESGRNVSLCMFKSMFASLSNNNEFSCSATANEGRYTVQDIKITHIKSSCTISLNNYCRKIVICYSASLYPLKTIPFLRGLQRLSDTEPLVLLELMNGLEKMFSVIELPLEELPLLICREEYKVFLPIFEYRIKKGERK